MKRKRGNGHQGMRARIWTVLGLLFLTAALCITGYYIYEEYDAWKSVTAVTVQLQMVIENNSKGSDAFGTVVGTEAEDMPTVYIDGYSYIGMLEIPSIGLSLPIMDSWSYAQLKISPCRYSGTIADHDIVICGHNYRSHFALLGNLENGAEACFTDMAGNMYSYTVSCTEVILPDDTALMVTNDGSWDMTLFTCTVDGSFRKAVRFVLSS